MLENFNLNEEIEKYNYSLQLFNEFKELEKKTSSSFLYLNCIDANNSSIKAKFLSHLNHKVMDKYNLHSKIFDDSKYNMNRYLISKDQKQYIDFEAVKSMLDKDYEQLQRNELKKRIEKINNKTAIAFNCIYRPEHENDIYNTQHIRSLINCLSMFKGGNLLNFDKYKEVYKANIEELKSFKMFFMGYEFTFYLNGNCKVKFTTEQEKDNFLTYLNK